jgi:biopolymer transport protein ExbD
MAFVPSKAKKNPRKEQEMPNLTSMMDMMTIILLFLLKSITINGSVMHPAYGIELPESSMQVGLEKHISFIINAEGIFQDKDGLYGVNVASAEEMKSGEVFLFPRLIAYLDSIRQYDSEVGRSERRIITVQGDKNIQYQDVYKFISTCGEAGFSVIQFIVRKEGD